MITVNSIYVTYQGEQNIRGIGAPVIFLRLAGCHLRCYLKTLGVLCDTPESLEHNSGKEMTDKEIFEIISELSKSSGDTKLICLSGGDPLYKISEDLLNLLWALGYAGFEISVESSGTLSISKLRPYSWVSYVLDYKSKSAGLKTKFYEENLPLLSKKDIIKFVLYDEDDYLEFKEVYDKLCTKTSAKIAVGCYWGGLLSNEKLVSNLIADKLLGKVLINMQAHKLLTLADSTSKNTYETLKIPKQI